MKESTKDTIIDFIVKVIAQVLIGLLISWIWPKVIPFVFPKLVEQNFITGSISGSHAILLSFICSWLFKNNKAGGKNEN